jgi:hypothetical protein
MNDDEHAHEFRRPGWGHPIMLLAVAVLVVFWGSGSLGAVDVALMSQAETKPVDDGLFRQAHLAGFQDLSGVSTARHAMALPVKLEPVVALASLST